MRGKLLVVIGGLALLVGPTLVLSQSDQPGGSFKGKSKGGPKGVPGISRPPSSGIPGGGPPGMSGRPFPGSPGGGVPGMGSGRGPNIPFDSPAPGQQASRFGGPSPGFFPPSGPGPASGSDGRRSFGGRGPDWSPETVFQRYDQNGDGVLNHDEMPDSLQAERSTWDRDNNGFIDPNEFVEYFRARMDYLREERAGGFGGPESEPPFPPLPFEEEERKPAVYRAGKLPPGLPAWFTQLDSDSDAQVGLYEWKHSGRSLEEFGRFDRNGDGFVTVQEMLRLVAPPPGQETPGQARGGSPNVIMAGRSFPGSPGAGPPSVGSGRFGSRGGAESAPRPGSRSGGPGGGGLPSGGRPGPGSSGRDARAPGSGGR